MQNNAFYLGKGNRGWIWSKPQQSILVLGPPRSGKTSSVIVPTTLLADGPVVSTSTKPEVMHLTGISRSKIGKCYLFDPTGSVECPDGITRLSWSPIDSSGNWDNALLTARSMALSTRGSNTSSDSYHWIERAESLLAPLFHAAFLNSMDMRDMLSWVNRRTGSQALDILESNNAEVAGDLLYGILSTDAKELSGIWSTCSSLLTAYRSHSALESATLTENKLELDSFVTSSDTIYICATGRMQNLVSPIIVGFLESIKTAKYDSHSRLATSKQMLFALDEVANIAPIPDLVSQVSEGGGQGVTTLACLQDLSQARTRWGNQADGFLTLFGTKVVFPGIADIATLNSISTIAGTNQHVVKSVNNPQWWNSIRATRSESWSISDKPNLPPEAIYHGEPHRALLIETSEPPVQIEVTPYYSSEPFKTLTEDTSPSITRIHQTKNSDNSLSR